MQQIRIAASSAGIELRAFEENRQQTLDEVLAAVEQWRPKALIVFLPPRSAAHEKRIVQFAADNRLPSAYWWREYVDAGGLVYYGPNVAEMYRRAAVFVDKILKGAPPGEIPVEQPTHLNLVINERTARALGLAIPPSLLARADEVIE